MTKKSPPYPPASAVGKAGWQLSTFYFELYQAHPGLLELSAQKALAQAEKLSHRTKANPEPLWPLAETVKADVPAMLRRAAINAARGAFKSFSSHLARWRKQKQKFESRGKRFHHRPPAPPRMFNFNPPFYAGLFKERTASSILVRLYDGASWRWIKLRLQGDPLPAGWRAVRSLSGEAGSSGCTHRWKSSSRSLRRQWSKSDTSQSCGSAASI